MTAIRKTLAELADILDGRVVGDASLVITGLSGLEAAGEGDLAYILGEKYLAALSESKASAVIAPAAMLPSPERRAAPGDAPGDAPWDTPWGSASSSPPAHRPDPAGPPVSDVTGVQGTGLAGKPCLLVENVHAAMEQAKGIFYPPLKLPKGVHPSAILGTDVELGDDVTIMANVVIEDGARIGHRSIVYPGVYVGHGTRIGDDAILYPNVVIRDGLVLGDRVIVHSGAVVGADGFGFEPGVAPPRKIAQVGRVVVGDDVEIGANTTIDRAALDETVIGRGTKFDNLVQVAHNVVIGEHCLLSSQVGIAGSSSIGSQVILGGQAGIGDHVHVGDQVIIAARSGVTKDVGSRQVLYGNPAGHRIEKQREAVSLRKMPRLVKMVKELVKRVSRLEQLLGGEAPDEAEPPDRATW